MNKHIFSNIFLIELSSDLTDKKNKTSNSDEWLLWITRRYDQLMGFISIIYTE
jgi:hypothetical protein